MLIRLTNQDDFSDVFIDPEAIVSITKQAVCPCCRQQVDCTEVELNTGVVVRVREDAATVAEMAKSPDFQGG